MKKVIIGILTVTALAVMFSCTPNASDNHNSNKKDDSIKVVFAFSANSDCSVCHNTQTTYAEAKSCDFTKSHANQNCIDCHTADSTLTTVHDGVDAEESTIKELKKTAASVTAQCKSCHDLETVANATAKVEVCTDMEGTTVNPHALPNNDSHQTINCSDCHIAHSDSNVLTVAPKTCLTCHHEDVYECGTCHE